MFNIEAEQCILGAILLENNMDILEEILLMPEDFNQEAHKIIYLAMLKLAKNNIPIDTITLIEELRKDNVLDRVGGISYITSLTTIVPAVSSIKYYAEIVINLATKRKLTNNLEQLILNIENMDNSKLFKEIEEAKSIVENAQIYESMFSNFSQINTNFDCPSIATGFEKLDKETHGLEYGTLMILTGEPSTGKSTLLNQVIANAISNGEKAFLYSGELPQKKLKTWFNHTVANKQDLQIFTDKYGKTNAKVMDTATAKIDAWINNKLFVFNDDQKPSESNLIGTITYLARYKKIRLVVLDNLMMMIAENLTDEYQKQKYLVNSLKSLAKKHNLVIILVAHVNKDSKKNNIPNMFEVAGASEIVNLADYVFKITKEQNSDASTISKLYILKNRVGGTQNVHLRLYFDEFRKRFYTQIDKELNINFGY